MDAKRTSDKEVIVTESGKGKYAQNMVIGNHELIADEPKDSGGNDLGPSPYGFLLAALGSCTSMTIRMYADFKKIPLEKVSVRLTIDKIHAEDCRDCENKNALVDHIERKIEVSGSLTKEQEAMLLDIANKCPVHRTLTFKVAIDTTLTKK